MPASSETSPPLRLPRPSLPALLRALLPRAAGAAAAVARRRSVVLGAVVALAACAPQAPPRFPGGPPGFGPQAAVPRTQVALLLPLSGGNAQLGRSMLNAAQLALFEQGDRSIEFSPRDTGGSPAGAAAVARAAVADGARVLVGPLTASETSAAAGEARAARAPMLALTNDSAQAGGGVWALGVTPDQQVRRVAQVAAGSGAQRFGALAPDTEFGRRLALGLRGAMADLGLPPPVVVMHPPRGDVAAAARQLAEAAGASAGGGLDAVLIGEAGERARAAAAAITASGLPAPPRLLGHALWLGDEALARDPAMTGAIFAAPDPAARSGFVARYMEVFDEQPSRLAGVAYDAAGLAARAVGRGRALPQIGGGELFLGADGPVRLLPDGRVLRGLAVFTFDGSGEPRLIEPAAVPSGAGI